MCPSLTIERLFCGATPYHTAPALAGPILSELASVNGASAGASSALGPAARAKKTPPRRGGAAGGIRIRKSRSISPNAWRGRVRDIKLTERTRYEETQYALANLWQLGLGERGWATPALPSCPTGLFLASRLFGAFSWRLGPSK